MAWRGQTVFPGHPPRAACVILAASRDIDKAGLARRGWRAPGPTAPSVRLKATMPPTGYTISWLRVSGTTEMPQVDERVCHQLHAIVMLLDKLEPQQQPFEFILPREGPLHA